MGKYIVSTYYNYVHVVEVEADSPREAFEIGYGIADAASTEELEYVGYTDSEVQCEDGEIVQFA